MLSGVRTRVPGTSSVEPTGTKITPSSSRATTPLLTPSPVSSSFIASPTEISSQATVSPYDDFEDEKFNGTFDTSLFSILFDSKPHGPFAVFAIQHIHKGQEADPMVYHKEKPIQYDQWYRFGFEIEHDNSTFHCLADGEELGNYSLTTDQYADRLANIRFLRWISNVFQEGTQATIVLDDFYLIPPP